MKRKRSHGHHEKKRKTDWEKEKGGAKKPLKAHKEQGEKRGKNRGGQGKKISDHKKDVRRNDRKRCRFEGEVATKITKRAQM